MDFQEFIFLYGPPGSGKTTVGKQLAEALNLSFTDLDEVIATQAGQPIPEIFRVEGEDGFRRLEKQVFKTILAQAPGVVALGGGALLDDGNRRRAESAGQVVCLDAPFETLATRLQSTGGRPLLNGDLSTRLVNLLERRKAHYASFPIQVTNDLQTPREVTQQAQIRLGRFIVQGMGPGYPVIIREGSLDQLGKAVRGLGFSGLVALVSDQLVSRLYGERALQTLHSEGLSSTAVRIPGGEANKTIETLVQIWDGFLQAGLERGSPVVALGGGVVSDLAGFAAATYLRGIPWIAVPTSLLAMADASLGGKTGADLPQGKNLIGAFHPPRLVLVDPQLLSTLPEAELRSGMAEVVKGGVIGDPMLFARCAGGWAQVQADWSDVIRRTMAVKIQVILDDPYERRRRAVLNFGHTFGHAIEVLSDYRLRHGEAVSLGMVMAARLSEHLGLAETGLAVEIEAALLGLGLPVRLPENFTLAAIDAAMRYDKKRTGGKVRFVLPVRVGEVRVGVEIDDWQSVLGG